MTGTEKQVKWAMEIKENYISEINQLIESLETRKANQQGKDFIGFLSTLVNADIIKSNMISMLSIAKEVKVSIENTESADFFIDNRENVMLNITKMVIKHF